MVGSIPPDLAREELGEGLEKLETVVQKVAAPGTGKRWHGESGRAAWRKLKSNGEISHVHARDLETSRIERRAPAHRLVQISFAIYHG